MERIHALTAEREEVLRDLERDRADKSSAQAALSEANDKNYEFMRSLGSAEQVCVSLSPPLSVTMCVCRSQTYPPMPEDTPPLKTLFNILVHVLHPFAFSSILRQ